MLVEFRDGSKFLSTPSARRATAKTEIKSLFSNKLYNILHEFRRALICNGSKVSCYQDQFDKLDAAGALELRPDGSAILTDTSCYSEKTGLAMDVETGIGLYF